MRKKSERKGMKVGSGTGSKFQEVKRVARGQKGRAEKESPDAVERDSRVN